MAKSEGNKEQFIDSSLVKKPEYGRGGPIWWHHHGIKMRVRELDSDYLSLLIRGSTAELQITVLEDIGWNIEWQIKHGVPETRAGGRTRFSDQDLEAAFGLLEYYVGREGYGRWLIDRYGATAANQGAFIRYKEFLNIPGPGTGNDGDPNISIEVDEEIQAAVKLLLLCKDIVTVTPF